MSADPGRIAAALLAVLLTALAPLAGRAGICASVTETAAEKCLDRYAARIKRSGCLVPEDYEKLEEELARMGLGGNISLTVFEKDEFLSPEYMVKAATGDILEDFADGKSFMLEKGMVFTVELELTEKGKALRELCALLGRRTETHYSAGGIYEG